MKKYLLWGLVAVGAFVSGSFLLGLWSGLWGEAKPGQYSEDAGFAQMLALPYNLGMAIGIGFRNKATKPKDKPKEAPTSEIYGPFQP